MDRSAASYFGAVCQCYTKFNCVNVSPIRLTGCSLCVLYCLLHAPSSGNAYVAIQYDSASITVGSDTFTNAGGYDVIIAKLSASTGGVLWAQTIAGSGAEYGRGPIAVDASDNVYASGYTTSTTLNLCDSATGPSTPLYMSGSALSYVVKLDPTTGR